jgi:farnesyl-diphosphate farnesyltransferase
MAKPELLTDLLKSVSRSFYLTLRVLPAAIRPQIGLAYLLARAADTIADTEIVPVEERRDALQQLRARILGSNPLALDFTRFANPSPAHPVAAAEYVLLARIEEALSLLAHFAAEDQQRVRDVLATIISGQDMDLVRFGAGIAPQPGQPVAVRALETDADLDDYTYRVAGCVGEFWTRMCRAHLVPRAAVDEAQLLTDGIRFGKGLQLVNILRDLPRDVRIGRCYLPVRSLAEVGLAPADLLTPASEPRLRPLYETWLRRAEDHLATGWTYTNALPRQWFRVRQACAWPILIGAKTLARLKAGHVLDPTHRIKTTRAEVRRIILRSLLRSPFPSAWSRLFADELGR